MIPALVGFASLSWGFVFSFVLFLILLVASVLYFRFKSVENAGRKSLAFSVSASLICFCVLTIVFLNLSFEGPPTPDERPSPQDLIGSYGLSSDQELINSGYLEIPEESTIVLIPDGTFIANEVPDILWLAGSNNQEIVSGRGRWEIYAESGLLLQFTEVDSTPFEEEIRFSLIGRKSPFILIILLGSELHGIAYERINP